jgi:hypothetical protein
MFTTSVSNGMEGGSRDIRHMTPKKGFHLTPLAARTPKKSRIR